MGWNIFGLVVLLVVLLLLSGTCGMMIDEKIIYEALETNGYSNIQIVDRQTYLVGCKGGDNDDARFECTAVNPKGENVTVYVFAGWLFKGATIRQPH
jgi:hypothetical protein